VGAPENRRRHFRLRYPPGAGPLLLTGGGEFRVTELSERGLCYSPGLATTLLGESLAGVLRFECGAEARVAGAVTRTSLAATAVRLARGVGLARMLAEQRRILRDFPSFLRPGAGEPD
jgi:hypothetical protein